MKFGICASPEAAATVAPGVLDYVELNLTTVATLSEEAFRDAKALLASHGIPAETTNCFFPGTIRLCDPDRDLSAIADYTRRALCRAREIGVSTCVLGSGKARRAPEGGDLRDAYRQFEESANLVASIAAEFGVTVVIEPLRKPETNVVNTVAEGAALVRRVSHPNLCLLADLYHVAFENEPVSDVSESGELLRHIHVANPGGRLAPLPGDGFDYTLFADALRAAKYDLRISIEGSVPGDYAETVAKSISYLRTVFSK